MANKEGVYKTFTKVKKVMGGVEGKRKKGLKDECTDTKQYESRVLSSSRKTTTMVQGREKRLCRLRHRKIKDG